jgi:hypothetical protein
LRAVSSAIRKFYKHAVGHTVGAFNWLLRAIAKLRNATKIPTGYQNETSFRLVSNLPKRKSTGRRFNEARETKAETGLHTDTPAMLSMGFLHHES